MYHCLLTDARFHNSLFDLDRQIANQIRQAKCLLCHGNLNQSNFPRKPRGVPDGTHEDYHIRFSLCCTTEGCRKRFTPPSMRFLSRKVYSSVVIILIFMLKPETDESRIEKVNRLLGTRLSVETLRRWRHYWVKKVPQSHTFKRAAFPQVMSQTLPGSLLALFEKSEKHALELGLRWLLPLTGGLHLFDVAFQLKVY